MVSRQAVSASGLSLPLFSAHCPSCFVCSTLPSFPDVTVSVRYATEHRCGVRLRGPSLSDCITGTDPLHDDLPLLPCTPTVSPPSPSALRTCRVVTELSAAMSAALSSSPIVQQRSAAGLPVTNVVLLRGAGARLPLPAWDSRGQGRGFAIAPTAIIAGLAMCCGLTVLPCPGATGDYHTDLSCKAELAATALTREGGAEDDFSFGFVHVKAVDDAGHDRSVQRKLDWLQRADGMIGSLRRRLSSASSSSPLTHYAIVVTGDHSTPVLSGDHSHEPVPLLLTAVTADGGKEEQQQGEAGSSLQQLLSLSRGRVQSFDEVACSRGVLGRFPGAELLPLAHRFCSLIVEHHAGKA